MSSDNQFTALGPTIIGFQTNGSNIERGADVQGQKLGIRAGADDGVGVHGISHKYFAVLGESELWHGVQGASSERAGVVGLSAKQEGVLGMGEPGVLGLRAKSAEHARNGVMGLNEGIDGAGVFGGHRATDSLNPPLGQSAREFGTCAEPGAGVFGKSTDIGIGVMGQSRFGSGVVGYSEGGVEFTSHGVVGVSPQLAGVVGISGDRPEAGTVLPPNHVGIYGFCASGLGAVGTSRDSVGVLGVSESDRGGQFESRKLAQIHLVPMKLASKNDPNGFVEGKGGDLLAIEDARSGAGDIRHSLWFCVGKNLDSGMAEWVLIAS